MIKLQGKLPREVYVACSGGVDSMAIVDFLKRNHQVNIYFFDHGTVDSKAAHSYVASYATKHNLPFLYGTTNKFKHEKQSWEEYWRVERYKFLHSINAPVITGHHLDDCVETWVWSSMHGTGKIIPYAYKNVIRPFRLNKKRELELWADINGVNYIEDESNQDTDYTRNYIRHKMMPNVLKVNPGIHKTVAKKVTDDYSDTLNTYTH